jgi:hypothetical protein
MTDPSTGAKAGITVAVLLLLIGAVILAVIIRRVIRRKFARQARKKASQTAQKKWENTPLPDQTPYPERYGDEPTPNSEYDLALRRTFRGQLGGIQPRGGGGGNRSSSGMRKLHRLRTSPFGVRITPINLPPSTPQVT